MTATPQTVLSIVAAVIVLGMAYVWLATSGLSLSARAPLLVYFFSYLLTYVSGATLISLTDSDIITVFWGQSRHLPLDLIHGSVYWGLLLVPFVVLPLAVQVLWRLHKPPIPLETGRRDIGLAWPVLLYFVATAYLLTNPEFRLTLSDPLAPFVGRARELYDARAMRLGGLSPFEATILYTIHPFLTFAVVCTAVERTTVAGVTVSALLVGGTIAEQLAFGQSAPTLVFGTAVLVGTIARNIRRNATVLLAGLAAVVVFASEYFAIKYEGREQDRYLEPLMRMPVIYPYYLLFVEQHGHPGAQLLQLFSLGRLGGFLTPWPTMIGSFVFPDGRTDCWMPAPAHVTSFADDGFGFAVFTLCLIGLLAYTTGRIFERAKQDSWLRALGISFCCSLYMATQSDNGGWIYQSWGIYWSLATYAVLWVLPRLWSRAATRNVSVAAPALRSRPLA